MADEKPEKKKETKKTLPTDQVKLVLAEKNKAGNKIPLIEGEDHAVGVFVGGKRMNLKPGEGLNMTREQAQAIISQSKSWDKSHPAKECLSIQERA